MYVAQSHRNCGLRVTQIEMEIRRPRALQIAITETYGIEYDLGHSGLRVRHDLDFLVL
jgi:hypothetical protein